jgi:dihydrodipicolinate synthase/N-acetylneuraminate lyase
MSVVWKGVFPAVTTKFTENDEFDFDAFDKNIEAQIEAGASGIMYSVARWAKQVCLTDDEKLELLKHTVQVVAKRAYVVLNIAEQTTKAALLCAANAEKYGADALMMLPPLRYLADEQET